MQSCPCESLSEEERIKCLIKHFAELMAVRGLHLSKIDIQNLLETTRLANIKLMSFEANSATEEFSESQILYTFISEYTKTHPRFQQDGPDIGDLKLKTTFFQAT